MATTPDNLCPDHENPYLADPVKFAQWGWPDMVLYDKQVEILESVRYNTETMVPAGNQLGKDFIAGFTAVWFFCSRTPCRVITSSVDEKQLEGVLWGEIRRFIQTCRFKLPILVNHLHIRKIMPDGSLCPLSYLMGRVTKKEEGMLGHHVAKTDDGLPRTLVIFDEASGMGDPAYNDAGTWSHRRLVIGNPKPCTNFFQKGVKRGTITDPEDPSKVYRKIIRIRAQDSPNVILQEKRKALGKPIGHEILVPGLIDYETYRTRRALLEKILASWMLDGEFYEGAETLLYPADWLDRAERIADQLLGKPRRARTMGVDSAEGGDSTVWTVIDEYGIIFQLSNKTHDTSIIPGTTIDLIRQYDLQPENVLFDRGGGGKQHADYLRSLGYYVRTVAFGEPASPPEKRYTTFISRYKWHEEREIKYSYKNRRAEMYGLLRRLLQPIDLTLLNSAAREEDDEDRMFKPPAPPSQKNGVVNKAGKSVYEKTNYEVGFAIPRDCVALRDQLSPLPRLFDGEGRLYLPPKNKKTPTSTEITIKDILGCSPDEADSLVLAVFGLVYKAPKTVLGAAF